MPTPQRFPGKLLEEEIELRDLASDPSNGGGMTYNAGVFKLRDGAGLYEPRPDNAGVVQASLESYSTTSTSYVRIGTFLYGGSQSWSAPNAIKVAAFVSAGSGAIRIIDKTNGDLVIAENTAITNTTLAVVSLGTIVNVPTDEAVWEIQALKDTSGTIEHRAAQLDFELTGAGTGGLTPEETFDAGSINTLTGTSTVPGSAWASLNVLPNGKYYTAVDDAAYDYTAPTGGFDVGSF